MYDAPLTDLGKKQAKSLGVEFSKIPRDALWITSPLTRRDADVHHRTPSGIRTKGGAMEEAEGKQQRTPTAADADDACFDENLDNMNTPLARISTSRRSFKIGRKK